MALSDWSRSMLVRGFSAWSGQPFGCSVTPLGAPKAIKVDRHGIVLGSAASPGGFGSFKCNHHLSLIAHAPMPWLPARLSWTAAGLPGRCVQSRLGSTDNFTVVAAPPRRSGGDGETVHDPSHVVSPDHQDSPAASTPDWRSTRNAVICAVNECGICPCDTQRTGPPTMGVGGNGTQPPR